MTRKMKLKTQSIVSNPKKDMSLVQYAKMKRGPFTKTNFRIRALISKTPLCLKRAIKINNNCWISLTRAAIAKIKDIIQVGYLTKQETCPK